MKSDAYRIKNVVLSICVVLRLGMMSTLEVDLVLTQDNCDALNIHFTVVKIEDNKDKMW